MSVIGRLVLSSVEGSLDAVDELLGGVRPGGGPPDASRRVDGASARVATNVETGREFGGDIGRDQSSPFVLATTSWRPSPR